MADSLIEEFLRTAKPATLARVGPKGGANDCWEWQGSKMFGYGYFKFRKKNIRATHVALVLAGQGLPAGRVAMHSCDNRPCINPAHLKWGTQGENLADMRSKGRWLDSSTLSSILKIRAARGERHGFAKLTDEQVRNIRADTRSQRLIADDYGVTQPHISEIKSRRKRASA